METAAVAQLRNLTVDEIVEAIEGLTDRDYLTIDNIGRIYSLDLRGWDTSDLLQEALTRLVEDRRHLPKNVNFVYGVIEIMRSLADERREQQIKYWIDNDDEMPDRKVDEDALRELIEEETLSALQARVGNDNTAAGVLALRAEGYKPDEICQRLSIKRTTYDSANKRIRRAVLKDQEETG
jgi:DNA-directed RNA polymerase specialized sigma24 family protein